MFEPSFLVLPQLYHILLVIAIEWEFLEVPIYDHSFRLAKASFLAELGLVLRSKIVTASVTAPVEHSHKTLFGKIYLSNFSPLRRFAASPISLSLHYITFFCLLQGLGWIPIAVLFSVPK